MSSVGYLLLEKMNLSKWLVKQGLQILVLKGQVSEQQRTKSCEQPYLERTWHMQSNNI